MSGVFLDTNTIIAIMNDRPPAASKRFAEYVRANVQINVSSVVVFELSYGVAKSNRRATNQEALDSFLSGAVTVVPFDEEDARVAGEVRAALAADGIPIGPYDVLIAGQALRRGATLVTSNVREYRRIRGLAIEDWSLAR